MIGPFQRLLLGRPLLSSEAQNERLSRSGALGAFGLDALSSVAYGPDEILYVLILAGAAGTALDLPIAPVRRHVRCADCRCDRAGNITFGAREASRSLRHPPPAPRPASPSLFLSVTTALHHPNDTGDDRHTCCGSAHLM